MKHTLRSLMTASALLIAVPAFAETFTVSLIQTNDIDRMEATKEGRGGFAKLAGIVKAERAKGPVIFAHAGDTLSPSLLSGIDKGVHQIDLINQIAPDAMVPGNHEFDFGPENFRARIAEAKFPVISSNIREPDGKAPANTIDDKIIEIKGVKFGLYGLTTEDTPTVSSPKEIKFLPSRSMGAEKYKALKAKGADIVIAVVHTPLDVDLALARDGSADIVISGHDEHLLTFFDGKHVITESGSQSDWVVITDLLIDRTEKDGKVTVTWFPGFRIIDTLKVEADPAIAAAVKGYTDKLDKELNVEIGVTETALDSRRATVRSQEAAIGNLITDAMREAVGADVAITNGGGIRADKQYAAGTKLTRRDILAELPFGNLTTKIEIKGDQIRAALENGVAKVETAAGQFPQVSGLTMKVDLSKPAGQRVLEVMIGSAPLDPAKTYTLATNDFMVVGGDGYTAFKTGKVLIDPAAATIMASQVIDYVASKKTISPKVEGRIVAVK